MCASGGGGIGGDAADRNLLEVLDPCATGPHSDQSPHSQTDSDGAASFIFTMAKIQSVAPIHRHWHPSVDPLRDIQALYLIQLNTPAHQSLII